MDEFIDRLPIRIAALAGLVIGSVSLYRGASLTGVALRVAVAMIVFGLIASLLRLLMQQSAMEQNYMGTHLDTSTPGMTAEDLALGEHGLRGDQGEIS